MRAASATPGEAGRGAERRSVGLLGRRAVLTWREGRPGGRGSCFSRNWCGRSAALLQPTSIFSMCNAQWCRLKGEEPPASVSKWWGFLLLFQMTRNNETLFSKMRASCIEILTWNDKPQCIVQERMQLFSGSKVTYLWEVFPYFPHFFFLRHLND